MIQDKPEVLFAATSSGRGVVVMVVVVVVVGERCLEKEREAKCSCIQTIVITCWCVSWRI